MKAASASTVELENKADINLNYLTIQYFYSSITRSDTPHMTLQEKYHRCQKKSNAVFDGKYKKCFYHACGMVTTVYFC